MRACDQFLAFDLYSNTESIINGVTLNTSGMLLIRIKLCRALDLPFRTTSRTQAANELSRCPSRTPVDVVDFTVNPDQLAAVLPIPTTRLVAGKSAPMATVETEILRRTAGSTDVDAAPADYSTSCVAPTEPANAAVPPVIYNILPHTAYRRRQ